MASSIDFSAQFGGRDAARAVLPHFRALKQAARETTFSGFPFPKLAFILRVDGEVNTYGVRGPANIDIDKMGDYVSVDIGITQEDCVLLGHHIADNAIVKALAASVPLLKESGDERLEGGTRADFHALSAAIRTLCESYEVAFSKISSGVIEGENGAEN